MYKRIYMYVLIFVILCTVGFNAFAEPTIVLEANKDNLELQVDEVFEVDVNLKDNLTDGAYGVYFDLMYNSMVFELETVEPGDLLPDEPGVSELLYARSPFGESGRLIVSNSLIGEQKLFTGDGTIVTLVFRTIRSAASETIGFDAANTGIYLNNMEEEPVALHELTGINVLGPHTYYDVNIVSPYDNYLTYDNEIDYTVQCAVKTSLASGDTVEIGLRHLIYKLDHDALYPGDLEVSRAVTLSGEYGSVDFLKDDTDLFNLHSGYNYVLAVLYVNGEEKATSLRQIYLANQEQGITIQKPMDNTIVSKPVIDITGVSTFADIRINNQPIPDGDGVVGDGSYTFTYEKFTLKEGFNRVVATAYDTDAQQEYKDVITIYYQRDESIFDFITPQADETFKNGEITITGVVDTLDEALIKVEMWAKFFPEDEAKGNEDYTFTDTDLAPDKPKDCKSGDIWLRTLNNDENFLLSHFIFESSFDLSILDGLGSGVLTFNARKTDKTGKNEPIEISRSVYIETNELKITVVQPNIISKDNLISQASIDTYLAVNNGITVSDAGRLGLPHDAGQYVYHDLDNQDVADVITTGNGMQYAVVNHQTTMLEIYPKAPGEQFFYDGGKRMYNNAYANCATELDSNSLLLGISNYNKDVKQGAGLLLLNNGLLRTARTNVDINHVQFIEKSGEYYYLYSSNSLYMHRFHESDVRISGNDQNYFTINTIDVISLVDSDTYKYFVNDFTVLDEGAVVILATERGLHVYTAAAGSDVYSEPTVFDDDAGKTVTHVAGVTLKNGTKVILYAYREGTVEKFSILQIDKSGVIKHIPDSRGITHDVIYDILPHGDDKFLFAGKNGSLNLLSIIDVFNEIDLPNAVSVLIPDGGKAFNNTTKINFRDINNFSVYGSGDTPDEKGVTVVTQTYSTDGEIEFYVTDDAVDGIAGFSFDAPKVYRDLFEVYYCLKDDLNDTTPVVGAAGKYTLDNGYILFNGAGEPVSDSSLSHYEYEVNASKKYLFVKFVLKKSASGLNAPHIENFTIHKKEYVKTATDELLIRGFIEDKTLSDNRLTINGSPVYVAENGFFDATVDSYVFNDEPVVLYAVNNFGETDTVTFTVQLVESEVEMGNYSYQLTETGNAEALTVYAMDVTNDLIEPLETEAEKLYQISGTFSGSIGTKVSAEVYSLDKDNDLNRLLSSYQGQLEILSNIDGVISGNFTLSDIDLIPGRQRITLRCMNPYGKSLDQKFDIIFNVADERIAITNYDLTTDEVVDDTTIYMIDQVFDVTKNENNQYTGTFELVGKVITGKPLDYVYLRADNEYITFSKDNDKNVSYIKVPVKGAEKWFSVYVTMTMKDKTELQKESFIIWPDSLQLHDLRKEINVAFRKEFTIIEPDFSPTTFDEETGKISLGFRFNESVPPRMLLRARLNSHDLSSDPNFFPIIRDASGDYITFENGVYRYNQELQAVDGINIIDWWLFEDTGKSGKSDDDTLIAVSGSDKFLVYTYDSNMTYADFGVTFPKKDIFYDLTSLADDKLIITFDERGMLQVTLNGSKLGDIAGYVVDNKAAIDLTDYEDCLVEGNNVITVHYELESKNIDVEKVSMFKLDSKDPVVTLGSVKSNLKFQTPYIWEITAAIKEANLKQVNLVYNNVVIDDNDPNLTVEVAIADTDHIIYTWSYHPFFTYILPDRGRPLYVEAIDSMGRRSISRVIDSPDELYYDLKLSNVTGNIENRTTFPIVATGSTESIVDYRAYANEQEQLFDDHLKYETTDLSTDSREDITSTFSMDTITDKDKKYIMFEFDSVEDYLQCDVGYQRGHTLEETELVVPVSLYEHERYTHYDEITSVQLNGMHDGMQIYSKVKGYAPTADTYVGKAKDIIISETNRYAFVLNELKNDKLDTKSIIVYDIAKQDTLPKVVAVIDDESINDISTYQVFDNYLFIACKDKGLYIYDITDITGMTNGFLTKIDTTALDVIMIGTYIYIAGGDEGMSCYNIENVRTPDPVFENQIDSDFTGYSYKTFATKDGSLYLLTMRDSSSDQSFECVIGQYAIHTNGTVSLFTFSNTCIVNNDAGGVCDSVLSTNLWFDDDNDRDLCFSILGETNGVEVPMFIYSFDRTNLSGIIDVAIEVTNRTCKTSLGVVYPTLEGGRLDLTPTPLTVLTSSIEVYDDNPIYGVAAFGDNFYLAAGDKGLVLFTPGLNDNWDFLDYYASNDSNALEVKVDQGSGLVSSGETVKLYSLDVPSLNAIPPNYIRSMQLEGAMERGLISSNVSAVLYSNAFEPLIGRSFIVPGKNIEFGYSAPVEDVIDPALYLNPIFVNHTGSLPAGNYCEEHNTGITNIIFDDLGYYDQIGVKTRYMPNCYFSTHHGNYLNDPRFEDIAKLDYIKVPIYRQYEIPLTHVAYRVDRPGDAPVTLEKPMGFFKAENTVLTQSGKVITYFPIEDLGDANGLLSLYDEYVSGGDHSAGDLVQIDYNKTYFMERLEDYVRSECPDQYDASLGETINLTPLNDLNKANIEEGISYYFRQRSNPETGTFTLGSVSEDITLYHPDDVTGYKIYLTDSLIVPPATTGARIPEKTRKHIEIPRTHEGTLSFWMRLEDEMPWFKNYVNTADPWMDYNTDVYKPLVAWGGDSMDYRFEVKRDALRFVQYKADTTDVEAGNMIEVPIQYRDASFYGQWKQLTLTWDYTGGLVLYVDGIRINEAPLHMKDFDFDKFIEDEITFGDIGPDVGSWYFSLAEPKVYNYVLTADEVYKLSRITNVMKFRDVDRSILIPFDGSLPGDVSADGERYEDTVNGQGFVASDGEKNYMQSALSTTELCLIGSSRWDLIRENTSAGLSGNVLSINLTDPVKTGYYHLTDGTMKSFDIEGAEAYTFSGTVLTTGVTEKTGVKCVIKINGDEKVFPVVSGDFKYTVTGVVAPLEAIDIYYELPANLPGGSLAFSADNVIFNAGRYKLDDPAGYPATSMRMRHRFNFKETVVVYYDPFVENAWELNNEEVVILDSTLYTIGIKDNQYYALLKTADGEEILTADEEISGGSHQLVLMYDFMNHMFRFYIDTKLQDEYDGTGLSAPFPLGYSPDVYNMSPGGSLDGTIRAQGVIDEFEIVGNILTLSVLNEAYINKTRIIEVINAPGIDRYASRTYTLDNNSSHDIDVTYWFDDDTANSGEIHIVADGINNSITKSLSCGPHVLNMMIKIGDLIKTERFHFIKNYAPLLKLIDKKDLIVRGDTTLHFDLERDLVTQFADKRDFIIVELHLGDDPDDLTLQQTITEDRKVTDYHSYCYEDGTKSDKIAFEVSDYDLSGISSDIHYEIRARYTLGVLTPILKGTVKVLDLIDPVRIDDEVTGRPMSINTGIVGHTNEAGYDLSGIICNYSLSKLNTETLEYDPIEQNTIGFNSDGEISLNVYYLTEPGTYKAVFEPVDQSGNKGDTKEETFVVKPASVENTLVFLNRKPYIESLELLMVNRDTNTVKYAVTGGVHNFDAANDGTYTIEAVYYADGEATGTPIMSETRSDDTITEVLSMSSLVKGRDYRLEVMLTYNGATVKKVEYFKYQGIDIDVDITRGPSGYIGYNNVYFNWEGFKNGEKDGTLKYRYKFDSSPWGTTEKTHIEFYNLEDGIHQFIVQAWLDSEGSVKSPLKRRTFIVDTQKPVIDTDLISLDPVYDATLDTIKTELTLTAEALAITDDNLYKVTVDGEEVYVVNGGFTLKNIPLDVDGDNTVTIVAEDLLGNITSADVTYAYDIVHITYPPTIADLKNPLAREFAKYSPLTVFGYLSDNIEVTEDLKVYVDDPYGRREATINFDRTFFVENVKINAGTRFKAIRTDLTITTEFPNGKRVTKTYPVYAKHTIKPVELDLDVHAVAGGATTTEVAMTAVTDVKNVVSWSFDYDGDGIYDTEYFTNERSITTDYRYSNVGIIYPRVRVITADGHFFSDSDSLIIHDTIIKADIKDIAGAKSLDIIEVDSPTPLEVDGYEYVFVLGTEGSDHIIKRYIIEANKAVLLDNNSVSINLTELGILYPHSIKVDDNADIYVAAGHGSGSKIFKLVPVVGGYAEDTCFNITMGGMISSFDINDEHIFVSCVEDNTLVKYNKYNSEDSTTNEDCTRDIALIGPVETDNIIDPVSGDAKLTVDNSLLWITDYKGPRVICASIEDFKVRDFFGEKGDGEGQFTIPTTIRVNGNYVYVLDQALMRIQVFEKVLDEYRMVCTIDNDGEYLPMDFMWNVTDFQVFTKLENQREYQYVSLVNSTSGQIALLRIPQWTPDTLKLKSNLIIYTKNNEIFTAKPDGADTRKLFSSGSLPGVDGKVDYPSIAPDGDTIVFVSRIKQYEYVAASGDYVFRKYDKLYVMDVEGKDCRQIDDMQIRYKEIDRPQFSFDGTKIIFSAKAPGGLWTIYEYDMVNNTVSMVFKPEADCMRPTYSPDDRYIAYVTRFYNHNEILIYDTENPDLQIALTNNDFDDDYPVWAPVFYGEVTDEDITSKIAFITNDLTGDNNNVDTFKKTICYTYIKPEAEGGFKIVKDGIDINGGNPDLARNELDLTDEELAGLGTISYPCFTGDGKTLLFESYKDNTIKLKKFGFDTGVLGDAGTPEGAQRPSGMKNRITGLQAEIVDGNDVRLTWNRFADENFIYTVEFISTRSDATADEKSFKSQESALIEDLEMGMTYYFRVFIKNLLTDTEATTSIQKRVVVPPVVARPIITIDENNPYLVRMQAWKPETDKPWEYPWKFTWFIDNYKVEDTFSEIYEYEFGTSGVKRIALEASLDTAAAKNSRSEDVFIEIKGDLNPYFEHKLIPNNADPTAIKLDASASTGTKIDRNNFKWSISGSNQNASLLPLEFSGQHVIQDLSNYSGNIYVTLTASSLPVTGQIEQNREEKSYTKLITLGLSEIKPVVIETVSATDPTLYTFDGKSSIGNIDWTTSTWEIFGPHNLYYETRGKSAFTYNFPETNENTEYTVVLNARSKATGMTENFSKMITVGSVPMEPVIDYKVVTSSTGGDLVTAKLLLSAASSKGNNIDWSSVTWNVPLAGEYAGSATQTGATVVYNLYNIQKEMAVDVTMTMRRMGFADIMETSKIVTIRNNEVPQIIPHIDLVLDEKDDLYDATEGDVYIFSALNSSGPNIDWNNVSWLIDGTIERKGSVVRVDANDLAENNQSVVVTLTLNSTGGGKPVSRTMEYNVESKSIKVVITTNTSKNTIAAGDKNVVQLSVRDSIGRNIDWERTRWFIYQGPENIVEKYGAEVMHTLPISAENEYYPVAVMMYFKGSQRPFTKRSKITVKGDTMIAIIKEETEEVVNGKPNVRTFSAADSLGDNIDWQSCKWTFGDSSENQYGPVVTHEFPMSKDNAAYQVTLTVYRRNQSGTLEMDTDTYKVNIGRDELEAVVSTTRVGNYVVFSAEESNGRGLMLDRTLWMFEGPDSINSSDSTNDTNSTSDTDITSSSSSIGFNFGVGVAFTAGSAMFSPTSATTSFNFGINNSLSFSKGKNSTTSETDSYSLSSGESSNNLYTGASCRKDITGWTEKLVTMVVYRALPDGTIETQSRTFVYRADKSEVTVIK